MTNLAAENDFKLETDAIHSILKILHSLENAGREFVLETVIKRLNISASISPNTRVTQQSTASIQQQPKEEKSVKDFLKEKDPKTDVEKYTCLAYYLTKFRETEYFKTTDLTQLNIEAGSSKIANPSATVRNATSMNKYLISVGGGKKKISALGEDVVEALPDRARIQEITQDKKKKRKTKAKSVISKKHGQK